MIRFYKKIEQVLKLMPIVLSLIASLYILIFCCHAKKEGEIVNTYLNQFNQNIQDYNLPDTNYLYNQKTDSFIKNEAIIISDTKYITIKKLNRKEFSVVLF